MEILTNISSISKDSCFEEHPAGDFARFVRYNDIRTKNRRGRRKSARWADYSVSEKQLSLIHTTIAH